MEGETKKMIKYVQKLYKPLEASCFDNKLVISYKCMYNHKSVVLNTTEASFCVTVQVYKQMIMFFLLDTFPTFYRIEFCTFWPYLYYCFCVNNVSNHAYFCIVL